MPACKSKGSSPLPFMGHTSQEASRVANTSGVEGPAEAFEREDPPPPTPGTAGIGALDSGKRPPSP